MENIRYYEGFLDNTFRKKLEIFCNENLAYLIDDGFSIKISNYKKNRFTISILKYKEIQSEQDITIKKILFKWGDVKDDIITFYLFLKEKYNLVDYFGGKANCEANIEVMTTTDEYYISDYELDWDKEINNIITISLMLDE